MARIDGFGISVDLPSGFEGEVFGIPLLPGETPASGVQTLSSATADPAPEARALSPMSAASGPAPPPTSPPVLHIATFPLPPERGDYGNGAVDHMGTEDIFIALCEFDAASAGTPLFAAQGIPRVAAGDFAPTNLHRSFPNHTGCQKFFTYEGRAFCLYVVLGSQTFPGPLVSRVNAVLERLELAS